MSCLHVIVRWIKVRWTEEQIGLKYQILSSFWTSHDLLETCVMEEIFVTSLLVNAVEEHLVKSVFRFFELWPCIDAVSSSCPSHLISVHLANKALRGGLSYISSHQQFHNRTIFICFSIFVLIPSMWFFEIRSGEWVIGHMDVTSPVILVVKNIIWRKVVWVVCAFVCMWDLINLRNVH